MNPFDLQNPHDDHNVNPVKYISTRGTVEPVDFRRAVMMGLAPDGGLLLPEIIPDVEAELPGWRDLSYVDLAHRIMALYTDLPEPELRSILDKSYHVFSHDEVAPLVKVNDVYIMELFHGPTLAFKDVALQFLGNLFEHYLASSGESLNVLGATSGDTGSAAICGLRGRAAVRAFIMHPRGRVSRVQELQMTTVLDENVFNIAIDGSFDDCQSIAKTIFRDVDFKERYSLGSVNSINWARVLAQVVYYFYGVFRVMSETGAGKVAVCVPTGNFGNIFAAYMAVRMGLPVSHLVLATNENDILARFFKTGTYNLGKVHETLSPSMDIQVASNFERYLYYRVGEVPDKLREKMEQFAKTGELDVGTHADDVVDSTFVAGSASDEDTLRAIRYFHEEYGYLMDPHTAVGVHVAMRHHDTGLPMLCIATAHPAKFGVAIREAVGEDVARHPDIDRLEDLPVRCDTLPASVPAVKEYLESRIGNA